MEEYCHSEGPGVQSSSAWQLQFLILNYHLLLQSLLSLHTWNSPLAQPFLRQSWCSIPLLPFSPSIMLLHSSFTLPGTRTFAFFTLRFRWRFFPTWLTLLVRWSFFHETLQSELYHLHTSSWICGCSSYSNAIRSYFCISYSHICACNKQIMHPCLPPFPISNSVVCSRAPFHLMIAVWFTLRDCSSANKCLMGKPISWKVSKIWLWHTESNASE